MRTMRMAVFLFTFLLASGVFATQSPAGHGSGQRQLSSVDDHLKVLSERLNLREDQQAKIKVILEDQLAQMQAIGKDEVSKERSLTQLTAANIRVLLNDEQRKTFDDMQREHRGLGMGQGIGQGSGGNGEGRGQGLGQGQGCQMPSADDHLKFLSQKVNLEENQPARIKILLEAQLAQMQAVRKDESLSQEERMSKPRSLRQETAAKIRAQLSEEQKKKFDELRQDPRERLKERQARGEDCSMIWNSVV